VDRDDIGLDELAIQEGIRKPWETLLMMTKTPYGLYAFTHKDLEHFAALVAAAERESVAASSKRDLTCVCGAVWDGEQMVHAPRKREWVGLTDEEIWEAERIRHQRHKYSIRGQQITPADNPQWHHARAIEAKLKEKNT
jgi:hypothetical protein